MDFIDEEDDIGMSFCLSHDVFQTGFEFAAKVRSCDDEVEAELRNEWLNRVLLLIVL